MLSRPTSDPADSIGTHRLASARLIGHRQHVRLFGSDKNRHRSPPASCPALKVHVSAEDRKRMGGVKPGLLKITRSRRAWPGLPM
jgi:hypothetical protein